jgi:PIN domain nuclease of toxin-antitoxin system
VLLWWMADDRARITRRARASINRADADILVSAVSVWEVAIKRGLGKLDAPSDLLAKLEQAAVETLPITAQHAERVGSLPNHHSDPFDRLLVAQALEEDLRLVSADTELSRYGVEVLW